MGTWVHGHAWKGRMDMHGRGVWACMGCRSHAEPNSVLTRRTAAQDAGGADKGCRELHMGVHHITSNLPLPTPSPTTTQTHPRTWPPYQGWVLLHVLQHHHTPITHTQVRLLLCARPKIAHKGAARLIVRDGMPAAASTATAPCQEHCHVVHGAHQASFAPTPRSPLPRCQWCPVRGTTGAPTP